MSAMEELSSDGTQLALQKPTCLVVGGGIGGCCAALALHKAGADVQLFEQAPIIEALGLGINLTPQAVKVLSELGLADELQAAAVQTSTMKLAGNKGMTVWSEPRGLAAGNQYPQYSIHRGKLAQMLFEAVRNRLGSESVHLAHEFESIKCGTEDEDTHAAATFRVAEGGTRTYHGDVCIGCDGLASKVRKVFYETRARFTGWVCWRGSAEMDEVMDGATMQIMGRIQDQETGAVLGGKQRDAAFVCYPIDPAKQGTGRMTLNWVAERVWNVDTEGEPGKEQYDQGAGKDKVLDHFAEWSANGYVVKDILEKSEKIMQFPFYDRDPVGQWTFNRVTLLGDAAHPMLPFGSQGGGQAILDAESLGKCVAQALADSKNVKTALFDYEAERLSLANAVVEGTRAGGDHMAFNIVRSRLAGCTDVDIEQVKSEIESARKAYSQNAGFVVADKKA